MWGSFVRAVIIAMEAVNVQPPIPSSPAHSQGTVAGATSSPAHPAIVRMPNANIPAVRLSEAATQRGMRNPPTTPIAEIDARRVQRVLRNLVGNAVEHGAGRPVELTLAANRTAAAITVRDHGIGLDSEEAQHVFDRFWRADPARVRTVGGSGLGLSISLEDARLHGGWLQVWGQPDQGAQFRLTLPLTAGAEITGLPLPLRPVVVRRPRSAR